MLRFLLSNFSKVYLSTLVGLGVFAGVFVQPTENHFQSQEEQKLLEDRKWRGATIFGYKDPGVVELEKKWNDIRPFFEEFKRDYSDLLLVRMILNGGLHYVDLLVKYSGEEDVSDWSEEALDQLKDMYLSKITKKILDDALVKAKEDAKEKKEDYFQIVNNSDYREVVNKIVNSQHPYVTVGDGHFRISEMAKFRTSAFNETKAEEEVIPFLLAKINSNQLEGALKRIPERISKWKEFQEWLKDKKSIPIIANYNQSLFSIWALVEEKAVVDYYRLKGGARTQLDRLVIKNVDINSLIKSVARWTDKENNGKESVLTKKPKQLSKILEENNKKTRELINDYPDFKKVELNGQMYEIIENEDTSQSVKLLLKNDDIATDDDFTVLRKHLSEEDSTDYLAIGLGVGGGVISLIVVGGLLYWFFRVKK